MRFAKERLKFSEGYQGRESAAGFVVLNLRGLDLEGINELWVDLALVDELRQQKSARDDAAAQFKALFGGESGVGQE